MALSLELSSFGKEFFIIMKNNAKKQPKFTINEA